MSKQYYDYNNKSWQEKGIKKSNDKYSKRKKKNNDNSSLWVLVLIAIIVCVCVFLFCTKSGQNIVSKFVPQKENTIQINEWEYANDNEISYSGFDMNSAQDQLRQEEGFVEPMVTPNTNNNTVSLPDSTGKLNNGNTTIVISGNKITTITSTVEPTFIPNPNCNAPSCSVPTTTPNPPTIEPPQNNIIISPPTTQVSTPIPTIQPTPQPQPTPVPQQESYEYDKDLKSQAINEVYNYQDLTNSMLSGINKVRKAANVNEVQLDQTLSEMATYRSLDMVKRNYYSHYYNEISQLRVVMYAWNQSGKHYENLAQTTSNNPIEKTIEQWQLSESHNAAMTSSEMTRIGIGITKVNNTYYFTTIYSK